MNVNPKNYNKYIKSRMEDLENRIIDENLNKMLS